MSDVDELLTGLQSENDKVRNSDFTQLLPISEQEPQGLYPHWDALVAILNKLEVSNKYYAIHLISNVVAVDDDNRFEKIFDTF